MPFKVGLRGVAAENGSTLRGPWRAPGTHQGALGGILTHVSRGQDFAAVLQPSDLGARRARVGRDVTVVCGADVLLVVLGAVCEGVRARTGIKSALVDSAWRLLDGLDLGIRTPRTLDALSFGVNWGLLRRCLLLRKVVESER